MHVKFENHTPASGAFKRDRLLNTFLILLCILNTFYLGY